MNRAKPVLFTPGPLEVPRRVSEYMADPPANYHRQDAFRTMFAENQQDLKDLIGIRSPADWHVTMFASTGTGANDVCLLALSRLGRGLIVSNGYFGERLVTQATECGVEHDVLRLAVEEPMDPGAVDEALAADPDLKWVFFVSHETRAGLVNPLVELGRTCKRHGLMVAADCVSSAYAYAIDLEAAQVDLASASSSKAIMAHPGLGMVFTRVAAVERLRVAGTPRGSSLDLVAEFDKQSKLREPRFGQPVALHAALRAACMHLKTIGIDAHHRRIRRQMQDLAAHLGDLGAPARVDPRYRSWVVCNFDLPPGFTCAEISKYMEGQGLFILYGIGGDKNHFQIATMGDLSDENLSALKRAFTRLFTARRRMSSDLARPAAVASSSR
ncbi:MAG: alanine--glyoxylate aminotransferase family protein [Deltaproteobacteria bacterium]|nr:alanine--glyoxylate aminotransferase family protein [Deltaproteobacteria bacterium]